MEPHLTTAVLLVEKALSLDAGTLSAGDHMYGIPQWDSLGQLAIVTELERQYHMRITDAATFERLTTISEIGTFIREIKSGAHTRSNPQRR